MRAAQINQYGAADVLTVTGQAAQPKTAPDQILVAVYAAGVNPFDITVRSGAARQMAELSFPATLGGDFAGVVAEIGEDVSGFQIGEAVYGQAGALSGHGSFAEFTAVKAGALSAKPQSLDFVQAAALPLAAVSACQALVDHIGLRAGQRILIHGGAGGIGSIAVQLAKHLGAFVVATVRGTDADLVRQLGADLVIDYEHQDFTMLVHNYDAVFDTVGGTTNAQSYQALKPGGSFVSMAADADEVQVAAKRLAYTYQHTRVTTERLRDLSQLVDDGVVRVLVDKVFPLDQAAAALEYLANDHPRGKVVIRVAD